MSYFKGWANRANQNHDELSGAGLGSAWECWVTASPFTSHWQWCGGCGQDSGWGRVSDCVAVWPSPSILFPCRIPVIVIRWLRLPSVSGIALTPNVSGIAETSGVCLKKKKSQNWQPSSVCVSSVVCRCRWAISGLWRNQSDVQESSLPSSLEPSHFLCWFFSTCSALKEKKISEERCRQWSYFLLQVAVLFSRIIYGDFYGSAKGVREIESWTVRELWEEWFKVLGYPLSWEKWRYLRQTLHFIW